MSIAGYVLAGGQSSRMGTNKALLMVDGRPLVLQMAGIVGQAVGSATVIGDPATYGGLDVPVIADLRPGFGPLSGIEAALRHSACEWNLILACDLAFVEAELLAGLAGRAAECGGEVDCVIPAGPDGRLQPLCGMYHRRCLPAVVEALDDRRLKLMNVVEALNHSVAPTPDARMFQNLNTPEDWNRYLNGRLADVS